MKQEAGRLKKTKETPNTKQILDVLDSVETATNEKEPIIEKTKGLVLAKIIRTITVAPFFALLLALTVYYFDPLLIGSKANLIMTISALTILPLLSYPVHFIVPALRKTGRRSQRNLAIAFSVIGYVVGFILSIALDTPDSLKLIFMTYLFSVILIAIFSFGVKFKVSAHATGLVGPVIMLCYLVHPLYSLLLLLVFPVCWSSTKLGRHTITQFIVGGMCPITCMLVSMLILGIV